MVWIQKSPSRDAAATPAAAAAAAAQKVGVRNQCTHGGHGTKSSLLSLLRSAVFDRLNIQLTANCLAAWVLWVRRHPVVGNTNNAHPLQTRSKAINTSWFYKTGHMWMQLTADCVAAGVLWVCWHPDERCPVRDGLKAWEALPERSGGAPAAAAAVTQQCVDLLAADQSGMG
jgi:hypothetical protein